ncbi:hypothetical protein ACROYT_G015193 [Oculina patagonica]
MQLPAEESKRHKIGHKLQRACRTRWLSTDKAVLGVWQDYVAILLTLSAEEFRNDATALGLLSQMKTVKFIGSIYILKLILPILATISKCFQAGVVSFAKIVPTLEYAKEQLNQIAATETPITVLKQDLQPEGRLHLVLKDLRPTDQPDQSLPTSHQETQLKSFLKKYVEALTENINARFQESSPVLDSFRIFDLLSVPAKTDDGFSEYGTNMIKKLADHYYPGPQHADDRQQIVVEWQKAKYDLLQWKENDLPQAIRDGEGSITATDWCLSKLLQPTYRSHYPMLSFIAEVCLSCPSKELPSLIHEVVAEWLKEKDRRKLKRLPPISTVASSSSAITTPAATLVPEVIEVDLPQENEQEDQEMPSSLEPDDPPSLHVLQSADLEPNFDAYVAALELQDCDEDQIAPNMEDSDYESDYFSD